MSASPQLEVLLKFFGNDSDFDREVGVTGSFQNHCPGSPIDKCSSLTTLLNALRLKIGLITFLSLTHRGYVQRKS